MILKCIYSMIFLSFLDGSFAQDMFDHEGMEALGNLVSAFSEVASQSSICGYECQYSLEPIPRPGHTPSSNGCGSYGIKVESDFVPGMTSCCDTHDMCYDTCGKTKNNCDKTFKQCIANICSKLTGDTKDISACKSTGNLVYSGVVAFGCDAFKKAQQNACICSRETNKKGQRTTTHHDF